MAKVKLGEVAREYKVAIKNKPENIKVVGLEHLIPEEVVLKNYGLDNNTFTKSFKKGQVLFGRRRAYLKKASVATFDGVCSGDIIVIEAIEGKIDKDLLPFIIQNENLFYYAISKSAGSLSPRVKWQDLEKYEFELPDIEEQRKLAKILWAKENLNSNYLRGIASLSCLKQKITKDFLSKNKDFVVLNDIVEIKQKSNIKANDSINEGKYKFFTCGQTVKYRNDYQFDEELILCSTGGTYMIYYANEKCSYSTDVFALKVKENYLTKYVYEILANIDNDIKNTLFKGTGLKHLNKKEFLQYKIPKIKLEEQKCFIKSLEFLDNQKFYLEQQIENIKNIPKQL